MDPAKLSDTDTALSKENFSPSQLVIKSGKFYCGKAIYDLHEVGAFFDHVRTVYADQTELIAQIYYRINQELNKPENRSFAETPEFRHVKTSPYVIKGEIQSLSKRIDRHLAVLNPRLKESNPLSRVDTEDTLELEKLVLRGKVFQKEVVEALIESRPDHVGEYAGDEIRLLIEGSSRESLAVHQKMGRNALHYAAMIGDAVAVQRVAKINPEKIKEWVNTPDSGGVTPLMLAVFSQQWDVAKRLISLGGDINYQGPNRRTILHICVINRHLNGIKFCLKQEGLKRHLLDAGGNHPIHLALKSKSYESLKLLLKDPEMATGIFIPVKVDAGFRQEMIDPINMAPSPAALDLLLETEKAIQKIIEWEVLGMSQTGHLQLPREFEVTERNCQQVVKVGTALYNPWELYLFCDKLFQVYSHKSDELVPFYHVLRKTLEDYPEWTGMVAKLQEFGASSTKMGQLFFLLHRTKKTLDCFPKDEQRSLRYQELFKNHETIERNLRSGEGYQLSSSLQHILNLLQETSEYALECQLKPERRCEVLKDQVNVLMSKSVPGEPYTLSKTGRSPLFYAIQLDDPQLLEDIKKPHPEAFKRELHSFDSDGLTLLHHAIGEKNFRAAEFLIKEGVSINSMSTLGWTPIKWAIAGNNAAGIDFCLRQGADIFAMDIEREPPLFLAVRLKNHALFDEVVKRGKLDLEHQNIYGETLWDVALSSGNDHVLQALSQKPIEEIKQLLGYGVKSKPINQGAVISKCISYLKLVSTKESPRDLSLLGRYNPKTRDYEVRGSCCGLSFLFQYYCAMDKRDEFFQILDLIVNWDGTKEALKESGGLKGLSGGYTSLQDFFEQMVNDIVFFQHIFLRYTKDQQTRRSFQFEVAKKAGRHLSVISPHMDLHYSREQLRELLGFYSRFPGKAIDVGGSRHAIGIYVLPGGKLLYYDPNHSKPTKVFTDINELADQVYDQRCDILNERAEKIELSISLMEFSRGEKPKPVKLKEDVSLKVNGFNPLHTAVYFGDEEAVDRLIKEGKFDLNVPNAHGDTPLMLAVRGKMPQVAMRLLKESGLVIGNDAYLLASLHEDYDLLRALVKYASPAPRFLQEMVSRNQRLVRELGLVRGPKQPLS